MQSCLKLSLFGVAALFGLLACSAGAAEPSESQMKEAMEYGSIIRREKPL
jgi:hypothetical protein